MTISAERSNESSPSRGIPAVVSLSHSGRLQEPRWEDFLELALTLILEFAHGIIRHYFDHEIANFTSDRRFYLEDNMSQGNIHG